MNLLCPNCQKMLTVPEQYAGQLMKCPLCAGTFTVPALPPAPAMSEPEPRLPPAPPPAPPTSPPAPSFSPSDTYGLKQEPVSTPLPPPPAPPPAPASTAPESITPEPTPGPSKSVTLPPVGYTRTRTLWFSPKVLQWVAPVCVVLIFILQIFFTWVGLFPGGVAAFRQSAWQAAFAQGDPNNNLKEIAQVPEVGASVLSIFYLFLFLPTLVITIGVIILPYLKLPRLPSWLEQLMPYRWGLVAVANLLVFFFLVLQLILGFDLESVWAKKVDTDIPIVKDANSVEKDLTEARRGIKLGFLARTAWLWLAFVLHLVVITCAGLTYWILQRSPNRPLPKIELLT